MTTLTHRPITAINTERFTEAQQERITRNATANAEMKKNGITTDCYYSVVLSPLAESAVTILGRSGIEYTVHLTKKVGDATWHVMVQPYLGDAIPFPMEPMTLARLPRSAGQDDGKIKLVPGWN